MTFGSARGVLLAFLVGALPACTRGEGLDTSKMPASVRADYEVFARRCSKCHSLARPLGANITDDDQWVLYVNRMRRQPASGISAADQAHILAFLRSYAADLRRIQEEKSQGSRAPQRVPVLAPSTPQAAPPFAPAPSLVDAGAG
jgi:hypothetical protein